MPSAKRSTSATTPTAPALWQVGCGAAKALCRKGSSWSETTALERVMAEEVFVFQCRIEHR